MGGRNKWTAYASYKEYLRNYHMFGEYAVDFKYILLNVNEYPDEELLELSNLISMVFLIDKTKDFQQMMETLKRMIEPLKKVSPEEFLMFKHWLMNIATSGMSGEQKKKVEESEEVESMLYNLERAITNEFKKYESKLEEVRLEEKIQVIKNLLQMGMDILTVVKATGLTEEQIKKVKEELH